jgi:hypothetical protein
MVRSDSRLVCRVQRALGRTVRKSRSGRIAPSDRAELMARIDRLRELGDGFDGVRLSRFVVHGATTKQSARLGGECVATEV